jgi:uncharacterized protein YegL
MTDSNLTHLAIIADRSGSMLNIASDMNGAIRQLLSDQAKEPGAVEVDITTFDHELDHPFIGVRPDDVKIDVIVPRGSTALNDAIGVTVTSLGQRLAERAEEDRPAHVIVVVVTDGGENASREYSADQVKKLVTEQTEQWGWTFMYLAANVDAFATGAGYGFGRAQTISYAADSEGTQSVIATASAGITRTRSGLAADFTDEEREAAGA